MTQHAFWDLVDNLLLYDHLRVDRTWGHYDTFGLGWNPWLSHVHRLLYNGSLNRLHFNILLLEVGHMSIVSYIKFY